MFSQQFYVETPLDGYGKPAIYISLLRQVCKNGAIAMAPAFREDVVLGKDPVYSLNRAVESFDSVEGYEALHQRFSRAQASRASLRECQGLFKILYRMDKNSAAVQAYEKVVGDVYNEYGVANLDALHEKRLRLIPAKCRVYDLLNLATEVSTHHANAADAHKLRAWTGTTLSDEYDLEGIAQKNTEFEGIFIPETTRHTRSRFSN